MIFCQYQYKNYHNGNTSIHPIQPYSWDNWIKIVRDNEKYCKEWNFLKWCIYYFYLFIGRINRTELPSFHPYWRILIEKEKNKINKNPNMTHKFLLKKFVPMLGEKIIKVNPYDNWFGISVYLPFIRFVRGKKEILMCIKDNEKYIIFKEKGVIKYKTKEGVAPSDKFINNFIK